MVSIVNTTLCDRCHEIFQGHWKLRQKFQTREVNNTGRINERETESEDSDFYERPEWLKSTADNDIVFTSPRHHSIHELKTSAQTGCRLCELIWDRVSDELPSLEQKHLELLSRAVGLVIVRHAFVESDDAIRDSSVSLDLQITYFVDGDSNSRDAYLPLNVVLGLLPARREPEAIAEPPDVSMALPPRTVDAITDWVQTCQHEHVECWHLAEAAHSSRTARSIASRVLDVGLRGNEYICLCETRDLEPHFTYVTLSHCWGGALPVHLTTALYDGFLQAIDIGSLPQTFRDAIIFTRALGVQYMWIDALCIIQDSTEDWLHESLLMATIYSFAYLNIAATSSIDGTGGLFKQKNISHLSPCIIRATWTGHPPDDWLCMDQTIWARRVEGAYLNKRAWVFQERLLAPRTVHFASDQIWWECRSTRANECFPEGVPDYVLDLEGRLVERLADFDHTSDIDGNEKWLSLLRNYTATRLTKDSDRLIALAGVAIVVKDAMKWRAEDYVAGLWRHDLLVDLLWRVAASGSRHQSSYVAPSWSWASVNGEIYFHSPDNRAVVRQNLKAELVDVTVENDGNAFGPVQCGSLILRARLHKICLLEAQAAAPSGMSKLRFGREEGIELTADIGFAECLDEEDLYNTPSTATIEAVWCQISTASTPHLEDQYSSEGLILQEATDRSPGVYRRVGWLRLFYSDTDADLVRELNSQAEEIRCLGRYEDGRCTIQVI